MNKQQLAEYVSQGREIEFLYNQRKKIYEPLSDYIINDYNTIIDVINKI